MSTGQGHDVAATGLAAHIERIAWPGGSDRRTDIAARPAHAARETEGSTAGASKSRQKPTGRRAPPVRPAIGTAMAVGDRLTTCCVRPLSSRRVGSACSRSTAVGCGSTIRTASCSATTSLSCSAPRTRLSTHRDDLSEDREFVAHALAGRRDISQREKRYVRKDGSILWALTRTSSSVTGRHTAVFRVTRAGSQWTSGDP